MSDARVNQWLLDELRESALKAYALLLAIRLRLFDVLGGEPLKADTIATLVKANQYGVNALLSVLARLGLLLERDDYFYLSDTARYLLRSTSRTFCGEWLNDECLGFITERIMHQFSEQPDQHEKTWTFQEVAPSLLTWPITAQSAIYMWAQIDQVCSLSRDRRTILDVGCGSGVRSFVLAVNNPGATIDCLDRKEILEIAQTIATEMGVLDQVHFVVGDVNDLCLENERYDTILASGLLHLLDPASLPEILEKLVASLEANATLVIRQPFLDPQNDLSTALYILEHFLNFPSLKVPHRNDVINILLAAGCQEVRAVGKTVLVASKQ